jgi:hypothetical protein
MIAIPRMSTRMIRKMGSRDLGNDVLFSMIDARLTYASVIPSGQKEL